MMLSSTFSYEIIQYVLIASLLYHNLIFTLSVSKSTEARLVVSDFCWICLLTYHWHGWLNIVLLRRDHLFRPLPSILQPISNAFTFKSSISTLVISIWIVERISLHTKQICITSAWTGGSSCTGSWAKQSCIRWKRRRYGCSFRARLISFIILSFFNLLINKVSPKSRTTTLLAILLTEGCFLSPITSWTS